MHIAKALALCAALSLIWYGVMLLVGWYDPGFLLLATASSAILVSTGQSWGIVQKLAS
jgi:hypothetical protein